MNFIGLLRAQRGHDLVCVIMDRLKKVAHFLAISSISPHIIEKAIYRRDRKTTSGATGHCVR